MPMSAHGGERNASGMLHLTVSLVGHGAHPAAWRASTLPRGPGLLPDWRGMVAMAEAAALDAVLFGPWPHRPGQLAEAALEVLMPDPLPIMASLIPRSGRIGLCGSVHIAHTEPFHTARAFAVMDNLSAGRTAMLADTEGYDQQPADFAHAPRAVEQAHDRAAEYLEVVARLWESWEADAIMADKPSGHYADGMRVHRIDHAGRFFTVRGPLTAIRPPQDRPVLVMRDASPAGLELAAASAELFLARCAGLAEARALRAALLGRAAALGRPEGALRVLMEFMPVLAATPDAAAARRQALDGMAGPPGETAPPCFTGTPGELAARMLAWQAAGACDGFNLLPAVLPDELGMICQGVVPALVRQGRFRAGYSAATLRGHLALPAPPPLPRRSVA